jgi:hypothetical protein
MISFILYSIIVILIGLLVRIFWLEIYILWNIFLIILGCLVSSSVIAICFQFFTLILTKGESYGSFTTYFAYSLVFMSTITIVWICIVLDIISMAIDFLKYIFNKN